MIAGGGPPGLASQARAYAHQLTGHRDAPWREAAHDRGVGKGDQRTMRAGYGPPGTGYPTPRRILHGPLGPTRSVRPAPPGAVSRRG